MPCRSLQGIRTGRSVLHHSVEAPDGTRKFLLQLADGRVVEAVGIPADGADRRRLTACVSSQVGCPMRCVFCATGKGGFARNLLPHEVVDQVLTVQEQFGQVRGRLASEPPCIGGGHSGGPCLAFCACKCMAGSPCPCEATE